MSKIRWDTVIFTSELGFLFHLPHWIDPSHDKLVYLVSRCLLHALAIPLLVWDSLNDPFTWKSVESIFNGSNATTGWILMAVSLIIYIISYIHHTYFTKPKPFMGGLYMLAHVSIINFVLDRPGHNVKTTNFTKPLIKAAQFIIGITVTFITLTIVPLQTAWGCYDPALAPSINDYIYGTCPTDGTAHHEICTYYPIVKCDTTFQPSIMNATIHYTAQILACVFVIYLLEIFDEVNYFKMQAALK